MRLHPVGYVPARMKNPSSRLLKQATGGFIAKIIAAGLGFVANVLFARYLGPEKFGAYAMTMSSIGILATLATLGLPVLVVRQVAIYTGSEDWGLFKGLVYRSYQWSLLAALFVISTGLLVVEFIPANWQVISVLGLLLLPLLAMNQIRAAILRGLHWVVLADVPDLLLRPVMLLLMIFVTTYLLQIGHSETWAMGLQLMATLLSFVVGAWLIKRCIPLQSAGAVAQFENRLWITAGITFLGVSIVSVAESQAALLLLGLMAGTKNAGFFQTALQLVTPLIFGLRAVNMSLQSKVAAAWSSGDKQQVQRLVGEAARLGMLVAILVSVVLLVFAEVLLGLYGNAYVEAATGLRILVLGQLINAASGSCGVVLSMTGHQREVFRGVVLALVVNTTLCLLLIPRWNVVGAAIAASSGLATWNIYLVFRARKLTGIETAIYMGKYGAKSA